jgi:hypothetical protein
VKPLTFRYIFLAIFYAPIVENLLTAIVVVIINAGVVFLINISSIVNQKVPTASYFKIEKFSFGLSLTVVYLLAVATHGHPTGVFAGITFIIFVFLIFPNQPRSFSLNGFFGSCIVHFVNNFLSLTISPFYLSLMQQLLDQR